MQYPVTNDGGSLYPTPPPTPGFPVAANFGDYIFYNGADWTVGDTKITVGGYAGQTNQGNNASAVGYFAGTTNQGEQGVAVGYNAANINQGVGAVALGANAGNARQGGAAVAIGAFAGYTDQADNTIILNATGGTLNGIAAQTGSFYVSPVRDYGDANTFSPLGYNFLTNEIGYAAPRCGIHTCAVGTTQVITITGLTTGGIVGLTYLGGAGQFFTSSVATANTLTVELGQTATVDEKIIWIVGKL